MTGPATAVDFIALVTGLTSSVGMGPIVLVAAVVGLATVLFRRMVKGGA